MQFTRFLSIFLMYSSTMYAMELTTTNIPNGIHIITDDLLTTTICSRLDRPARDAFRRASKKYFTIVLSQDALNNNYKNAYELGEVCKMIYWKSMGGLLLHQEFSNAIKNKKEILATWLFEKKKVDVWNAYCCNIKEAVETATVEEIVPVIKWLLLTRKPVTYLNEFLSGYDFAKNLVHQYPEVKKIVDLFEAYQKEIDDFNIVENQYQRLPGRGFGLWHARDDYC